MTQIISPNNSVISSPTWGEITGMLADQTDLIAAINGKENIANKTSTITASTTNYPTNNAVISYVTASIVVSNLITSVTRTTGGNLTSSDANRLVRINASAAATVTVPVNIFSIGTQILVKQVGAGTVTIAPASGVSIASFNSRTRLAGQNAICSLIQESTNVWALEGNLIV